jgi:hypothetical protein
LSSRYDFRNFKMMLLDDWSCVRSMVDLGMHEDTYDIYLLQQRSINPKHFFQFEEAKEIH